jgi:isochorismate synthase EntC
VRRGKTIQEDQMLEAQLLSDEKQCAEHVMLVDLGRNDVGKVSFKSYHIPIMQTLHATPKALRLIVVHLCWCQFKSKHMKLPWCLLYWWFLFETLDCGS